MTRLRRLRNETSYSVSPTSAVISAVMNQYLLGQKSFFVAKEAYDYLDKFLFLQIGRNDEDFDRNVWMKLILSAMRHFRDIRLFEEFGLDNMNDLKDCQLFFNDVIDKVVQDVRKHPRVDEFDDRISPPVLLLKFLVKLLQNDFDIWWKDFRTVKDSHPIIHYLFGGGSLTVKHFSSALKLYKILLHEKEDLTTTRTLLSMIAMLVGNQDNRGGQTNSLASRVADQLEECGLDDTELFVELSLLGPGWFSDLVAKNCNKGRKNMIEQ